ncbi:MAG: hypothetical protein JSV62_06010 [Promethearchaeota archaeon]|nr:MAG: hypothetical protein JSV62_06010 [Candidatus Lokiarchaeota archaeon]
MFEKEKNNIDKAIDELDDERKKILMDKAREEGLRMLSIEMEGGEWYCCYQCEYYREITGKKGFKKLKEGILGKCLNPDGFKKGLSLRHVIYKKSEVLSTSCYKPKRKEEEIKQDEALNEILTEIKNYRNRKEKKKGKKEKDYRKRLLWHKFPKEDDKEEVKEKKMAHRLSVDLMLSSSVKQRLIKELENTRDEALREQITMKIRANKEFIKNMKNFRDILSEIITISKILKNESLTDGKKRRYIQKREELRKQLKEDSLYRIVEPVDPSKLK